MDLYLIRHAESVQLGNGQATKDAERPLTAEGDDQARHLASGLQRKGVRFTKVLTRPLIRARQTAEQMLRNWGAPAPELGLCDELVPGTRPRKLARALRDLDREAANAVELGRAEGGRHGRGVYHPAAGAPAAFPGGTTEFAEFDGGRTEVLLGFVQSKRSLRATSVQLRSLRGSPCPCVV